MKSPKPFEAVVVVWHDAMSEGSVQFETPALALAAYKPCVRRSIGFWVGRTADVVMIATDDDRNEESPDAVGGIASIPAGMVRSVELLCRVTVRKRARAKR